MSAAREPQSDPEHRRRARCRHSEEATFSLADAIGTHPTATRLGRCSDFRCYLPLPPPPLPLPLASRRRSPVLSEDRRRCFRCPSSATMATSDRRTARWRQRQRRRCGALPTARRSTSRSRDWRCRCHWLWSDSTRIQS